MPTAPSSTRTGGASKDRGLNSKKNRAAAAFILEAALPLLRPGIVGIGATVSPENQYSLNNALACGFTIAARREMYGGYDRYLLEKRI